MLEKIDLKKGEKLVSLSVSGEVSTSCEEWRTQEIKVRA
jgi:hypothetical protein